MTTKGRFNEQLDFYTEEEWQDLRDDDGWTPALRLEGRGINAVVLKETPR